MSKAGRALGFFLSLCALYACGRVRDDVALEELDVMALDALCDVRVRCGQYADKRACAQASPTNRQRTASVRAGRAQFDGKAAAACLEAYASLGCRLSEDSHPPEALDACKAMFVGTVEEGGTCLSNAECVSQLCNRSECSSNNSCCTGTCQTRVPLGGDCSAPGSLCVETAVCLRFASQVPAICTPMAPTGHRCSAAVVCETGKICNLDPGSDQGTCGDAPGQGAPCPSGVCDDRNDYCDDSTGLCLARGGIGSPCTTSDACVGFAHCDLGTFLCVAKSTAGSACAQVDDCVRGLSCTAGLCTPRPDSPACGEGS